MKVYITMVDQRGLNRWNYGITGVFASEWDAIAHCTHTDHCYVACTVGRGLTGEETWLYPARDGCLWRETDEAWMTSCGETFIVNDGTPAENRMLFCYHCGKRLVEANRP